MSEPTVPTNDRAWVLRGAGLLDEVPPLKLPDAATLLAIDYEMREFAHRVADGKFTIEGKVNALADALTEPTGLGLQYDAAATLSARDAFKARSVNCLSYTMLYVALAREVGIDANFNDVQVPLIWGLQDESFILYRHVNARVTLGANYFVSVQTAASYSRGSSAISLHASTETERCDGNRSGQGWLRPTQRVGLAPADSGVGAKRAEPRSVLPHAWACAELALQLAAQAQGRVGVIRLAAA